MTQPDYWTNLPIHPLPWEIQCIIAQNGEHHYLNHQLSNCNANQMNQRLTGFLYNKGRPRSLTGSELDHRSLPLEFKSRHGHIWRVFHLWPRFITFGGGSAHLAYYVHKSGRKTPIFISNLFHLHVLGGATLGDSIYEIIRKMDTNIIYGEHSVSEAGEGRSRWKICQFL